MVTFRLRVLFDNIFPDIFSRTLSWPKTFCFMIWLNLPRDDSRFSSSQFCPLLVEVTIIPKEDLAKSGYTLDMKYKFLIIFLFFLATYWKPNIKIWPVLPPPPPLPLCLFFFMFLQLKPSKITYFPNFLVFNFTNCQNFTHKKKTL